MQLYTLDAPYTEAGEVFTTFAREPYALFLDSADRAHPDARYSFIAINPCAVIAPDNDPFAAAQKELARWNFAAPLPGLPPFQGGVAGFFAYDGESRLAVYDSVMAFDHHRKKCWIFVQAENEPAAQEKRNHFTNSLPYQAKEWDEGKALKWQSSFAKSEYERAVARVIEYIRAGDIFQANLSQRFSTVLPQGFDAYAHYTTLRAVNPAPFAGFMNGGDITIASASPERFLKCHDGRVETKPIKGTAPRNTDPALLKASEKDRAENIMIVDLMRNDLSKICDAASVEVEKICEVETFARVHHLVSTIQGTLKAGKTAFDSLAACFPGGSITGAPKIRAIEIIRELESTPRGPYCGSLGYIGAGGTMDTNILIRTLVYKDNSVSFNVGGGVTASSDPAAEYQETLDKAEAIFASFEHAYRIKKRA